MISPEAYEILELLPQTTLWSMDSLRQTYQDTTSSLPPGTILMLTQFNPQIHFIARQTIIQLHMHNVLSRRSPFQPTVLTKQRMEPPRRQGI
jgi:hypothetical protein